MRRTRARHAISEADWDRLVSQIYDTTLDKSLWQPILENVTRLFGASSAQFVTIDRDQRSAVNDVVLGLDNSRAGREFEELLSRGEHLRANWSFANPGRQIVYDYQHSSESEMKSSLFYQEHARPLGVDYYVASTLRPGDGSMTAIALFRNKPLGHFGRGDIELLARLSPHLERSLLIANTLAEERLAGGIRALLEALPVAAIVIDVRSAVFAMNDAATQALNTCPDPRVVGGFLRTRNVALSREIAAVSAPIPCNRHGNQIVVAPRSGGAAPLYLVVARVPTNGLSTPRRLLLVLMIDPDRRIKVAVEVIRDVFGCSAAEGYVAARLAEGATLHEIARERGTTYDTVRQQLRNVFQKTRCTRQPELVAKLLQLAFFDSPPRPGAPR